MSTKIFYQRAYRIGEFLQEKIAFEMEADVDPITDPELASEYVQDLKNLCDQAHKKINPGLYVENTMTGEVSMSSGSISIQKTSHEEEVQAVLKIIEDCHTLRNLEMFSNSVQKLNDQRLFDAYNNKKKQLK